MRAIPSAMANLKASQVMASSWWRRAATVELQSAFLSMRVKVDSDRHVPSLAIPSFMTPSFMIIVSQPS